jgi:hypothetical protein
MNILRTNLCKKNYWARQPHTRIRRESEESGGTDTMSDTPDVDLFQLQMNTLRFVPYPTGHFS